jgi:glyoxylate reductase
VTIQLFNLAIDIIKKRCTVEIFEG